MSTSTLTAARTAALPRVNLLPPEIAEAVRLRKVKAGLGAVVVGAVAVVGLLYVQATGAVNDAQDQVAAAQARTTQINAETAKYSDVPRVYAQVAAAQAQLEQAMGQEVRWSYYLNDLSLTIPPHVWLTQLQVTTNNGAAGATPAAAGAAASLTTPGIGSVKFSGVAYSHNDVAAWLDALAKQKGYADAYFSKSEEDPDSLSRPTVKFDSTVTVTSDALSGRYTQKAGN
ncbi:MAG: PilN domain-containing protein [Motilibacteraceae bacterium]